MALPEKKRILVVDDNAAIHEDVRRMLHSGPSAVRREAGDLERDLFGEQPGGVAIPELPFTYTIDDAFQGEEAIAMVGKAQSEGLPYALLFMDVRMPPGIDGIKAIKEIWREFPLVEVCIITAYSDYSWDGILKELGPSDHLLFLRKPFDAVSVRQTTLALCTKWSLDRQNRDLIGSLEAKVKKRTADLKKLLREREHYIATIQEELNFAETVQRKLLPQSVPLLEAARVSTAYIPAEKVGGDFYDILRLDESTVAFLIFDVSGHGLAAALLTAIAKASFQMCLKSSRSPKQVFDLVNTELSRQIPECMFITAFLMVMDLRTRTAVFSNAGHVSPLLYRPAVGTIEELREGGPFLGIFKNAQYVEKPVSIGGGDRLVLYTDGLTEARGGPDDKLFGRERLKQLVSEHSDRDCEGLLAEILRDNDAYINGKPREDDVCVLIIDMLETAADGAE